MDKEKEESLRKLSKTITLFTQELYKHFDKINVLECGLYIYILETCKYLNNLKDAKDFILKKIREAVLEYERSIKKNEMKMNINKESNIFIKELGDFVSSYRDKLEAQDIAVNLIIFAVGFTFKTCPNRDMAIQFIKDSLKEIMIQFKDLRSYHDESD